MKPVDKHMVAKVLEEISRYLELQEPNRFRAMAFQKAARSIESLEGDLAATISRGLLEKTPGIGKAIGPMIRELVETGSLPYLDELRAQYPAGIFQLMKIPGLGLKKIAHLYQNLGIGSIEDLQAAASEGRLRSEPGFGKKTEEKILEGIEALKSRAGRFLLASIDELATILAARLEKLGPPAHVEVAGSIRRKLEIVQNINLVAHTKVPDRFLRALEDSGILDALERVDEDTVRGSLRGDLIVETTAVVRPQFATTLFFLTGSSAFTGAVQRHAESKGFELLRDGLFRDGEPVATPDEKDLFSALGLPFIVPEMRDTTTLPSRKRLPRLIHPEDILGPFHVHTTYSDGRATLREMLEATVERGFSYVGISDHSKTASYAGGLDTSRLKTQFQEIESLRPEFESLRIFKGTEADILEDGAIDWDEKTLATFDFVIASVHSRFKMQKDAMTDRIVNALRNPFVTMLGHMTGRKLLSRPGYELDVERIFEVAGEEGVIIEINGNPNRLDIDWRLLRSALDRGVLFSINPDAHSTSELDHTTTGTWPARKAGLSKEHVFNTRDADEVAEYLTRRRLRALER